MINYHEALVKALETVLPTYYELILDSSCVIPCISYQERNNYATAIGDTIGVSHLTYTIKIWGHDIGELQTYALAIDEVLRPLGWKRTSTNELFDINSTMIQKVMTFEANGLEDY